MRISIQLSKDEQRLLLWSSVIAGAGLAWFAYGLKFAVWIGK